MLFHPSSRFRVPQKDHTPIVTCLSTPPEARWAGRSRFQSCIRRDLVGWRQRVGWGNERRAIDSPRVPRTENLL